MGFFDEILYPTRKSDSAHRQPSGKTGFIGTGVTDLAEKQGFTLDIYSLSANEAVSFPAFLDGFSDAYNSEWTAEQVFGRMDPISTFAGTRRAISVSWKVPAYSLESAKQNLYDINRLVSFLYPRYDQGAAGACGATTINLGPLMRIKFGNLIQSSANAGGLLGYVNGITFDPLIEDGVFMLTKTTSRGVLTKEQKAAADKVPETTSYYPKNIRLNFEFTVLHEHELGFTQTGERRYGFKAENFPYTVGFTKNEGPREFSNPPQAPPSKFPDAISTSQQTNALNQEAYQQGYADGKRHYDKLVALQQKPLNSPALKPLNRRKIK